MKSSIFTPNHDILPILGVSEVQFCTIERPQLFEFEVTTCRTCRLKLPRLICKNDEALRKAGVLACGFDTPKVSTYVNCKYLHILKSHKFTYLWVFKLEDVEKPFEQTSQMWGFSPVWVRKCLFKRLGRSNILPQTRQGSIVLVLFLLPLMLLHSISFLRFPVLFTICEIKNG